MSPRPDARAEAGAPPGGSFARFIRSLLDGVPWSERAEREEEQRLPAPDSGRVRLFNSNGRTRVIGEDRDDVWLHAAKSARAESPEAARELLDAIRVVPEAGPDGLEMVVTVPRKWNRRGLAHLTLRVPRETRVDVQASNGKVWIEGLRAPVRARSSNGAVCVEDVVGDVEVETSNAKVCCSYCRGRLQARSSNGKIELLDHRGSVNATTSNGFIRASLESLDGSGVLLATSNGRIVLELPADADADVDIRVDNGMIRNERKLDGDASDATGRVRGRLGKGGPPVKLRTSNGSVCLR